MTGSAWRSQPPVEAAARRSFLDSRRRSHAERMTAIHAPTYDEDWGAISPSHAAFVGGLLDMTRRRGTILDAACGTGKYWPVVLASGRTVVGVDQAAGMLAVAARKHPAVPLANVGLQDLAFDALFDAVMCVDALENVGPEDWPTVVGRLHDAARPGAPLYLTVEVADDDDLRRAYERARDAGAPVVPGEDYDGVGYHYYPTRDEALGWLAAANLQLAAEGTGDDYWHLLLRRR